MNPQGGNFGNRPQGPGMGGYDPRPGQMNPNMPNMPNNQMGGYMQGGGPMGGPQGNQGMMGQQPGMGGFPPQGPGGQNMGGYPPQQRGGMMGGYPPQGPGGQNMGGYPPQGQFGGPQGGFGQRPPMYGPPQDLNSQNLTPAQEKILKKFNTLDRGTYYLDQKNKSIHFFIQGTDDLIGWHDDYLINGYLLHGLILKVDTLTSRIFLFIEVEHEIYNNSVEKGQNGKIKWSNRISNEMQIITISNTEKVEVYDNFEEGFEGFICYIVTEESKMNSNTWPVNLSGWIDLQRNLVLYEPTSIRKIYLDNLYNWLEKPESSEFNGKRIAALINPDIPGETVKYSKRLTFALEKKCVVGSLSTQYGVYTLMAEQVQDMKTFSELVEKALDIAEELGAYVMITNLRRTFDYDGKTVLYLPNDPTLKILTYDGAITFSNTSKKSLALN